MKKLRQFQVFDVDGFFKDKDVRVMAHETWYEYQDGQISRELGTKYKTVIAVDKTEYGGEEVPDDLNGGYQVDVKVPQPPKEYKKFSKIKFVNASATVYGQFMSELSVKADDVNIEAK